MKVLSKRVYKARKEYTCACCNSIIKKYTQYMYKFEGDNGKARSVRTCLTCEKQVKEMAV